MKILFLFLSVCLCVCKQSYYTNNHMNEQVFKDIHPFIVYIHTRIFFSFFQCPFLVIADISVQQSY